MKSKISDKLSYFSVFKKKDTIFVILNSTNAKKYKQKLA